MKKYLIQKTQVINGILYLSLSPVTDSDRLFFVPGQYAALSFAGYDGKPSPSRCFSIVSTPNEPYLQFAIKIMGGYTQTLAKVPSGSEVSVLGPYGQFTLGKSQYRGVILIAGGIGITPFISMVRSAAENGFKNTITLLYSCRSQDDIPFFPELQTISQTYPKFRFGCFISDGPVDKLSGVSVVKGRINAKWLRQVTGGNLSGFTFYLCGPTGMMTALQTSLEENGISPEQIKSESFSQASKVRLSDRYTAQSLVFKIALWSLIATFLLVTLVDINRNMPKLRALLPVTSQPLNTTNSDNQTVPTPSRRNRNTTPSYNTTSPSNAGPSSPSDTITPSNTYQPPTTRVS